MIARFLTEKFAVRSTLKVLQDLQKRFQRLENFGKESHYAVHHTIHHTMTDGNPGLWFYGEEEDTTKFLCFSYSCQIKDDIVDAIVFVFEKPDGNGKRLNYRVGNYFPSKEKEAAKRSSAFVRSMVKKAATFSSRKEIDDYIEKTTENMEGFFWEMKV